MMARYLHIWRATLRSEYPQLRDRVQEDLPFPVRFQPNQVKHENLRCLFH